MSQRVFYIVHLDKARIASLAVIVAGLLLTAFATGYRTGNAVDPLPTDRSNIGFNDLSFNDLSLNETIDSMAERQNDTSVDNDQVHSLETSATDSKEPNSLSNSSIDLLATKETNLEPKQRVNLLDSALDTTEDNNKYQNLDATSEKVSRSSDKKVDDVKKAITKKPTTKESQTNHKPVKKQKKTTKKEIKNQEKTQVDRKDTKKETAKKEPTTVAKKEPKPDIYLLQMGAYQSREAALRLSDQIRQHGIQTYVRKTGNVHTVRTEAVTNRQQLFQTEKKLKSLRFSPITVMIKENN